jgi:hypothetical protein
MSFGVSCESQAEAEKLGGDSPGGGFVCWGASEARPERMKNAGNEFQTKGQWVLEVLKLEVKVQTFKA